MEPFYPIRHDDDTIDKRYRISSVYRGRKAPDYVAYFCDEMIYADLKFHRAVMVLIEFYNKRLPR